MEGMVTALTLAFVVVAGSVAYVLWAAHEVAGGASVLLSLIHI